MSKKYLILLTFILQLSIPKIIVAQSIKVSGVVTARSDGKTLPGVSILVAGTTTGTQTDADGKFSIAAKANDVLRITYVGFKTQNITIKQSETNLPIILEDAVNTLNEVVVTALNISKDKKSLGYAVQALKAKDISEAKETNLV
ncbi:MAG: SusC/RagA family TonB-linked outer membrane protein, partial [Sphingobacteriaceae bacterium]